MTEVTACHSVLDPYGDITLLLENGEYSVRVSSHVLRLASPVFAAMFSPDSHFLKADASKDGTTHVSLPEDQFEPMDLALKIMHHKNETLPEEIEDLLLDQLAEVCDKYDLLNCIRLWVELWSKPILDELMGPGQQMGRLELRETNLDTDWLFLSVVFENDKAFEEVTRCAILNSEISETGSLDLEGSDEGVPSWVLDRIKIRRKEVLLQIVALVRTFADGLLSEEESSPRTCRHTDDPTGQEICDAANLGYLARYFPELLSGTASDADYDHESVRSYIERLRHTRGLCKRISYKKNGRKHTHYDCDAETRLIPSIASVFNAVGGLSFQSEPKFLICVKVGPDRTLKLNCFGSRTVEDVRRKVAKLEGGDKDWSHDAKMVRGELLWNGSNLLDDLTVETLKTRAGDELHLEWRR